MSQAEFCDIKFTFMASSSEENENQALELNFARQDFTEVEGESATNLFKIAANEKIGKV